MEQLTYEITRSYSRTIQVTEYHPENFFASHKVYHYGPITPQNIRAASEALYEACKQEVELAIAERLQSVEKEIVNEDNEPY